MIGRCYRRARWRTAQAVVDGSWALASRGDGTFDRWQVRHFGAAVRDLW